MAQEDLLAELLLRKKNIKTPQDAFKFSEEVRRATTDATFANDLRRNYRAGRLMPDPERSMWPPSEWTPGGIAETAMIAGSMPFIVPYPPINLASRAGLGLLGLGRMAESAKRSSEGRESGLPGSGKFVDSPAEEALYGALDLAWAPAGVAARKGAKYAPSVAGSLWRRLRGTGRAAEDVPAGGASRVDDVFDETFDANRSLDDVPSGGGGAGRAVDDAVPKLGKPTELRVDLNDPEVIGRIKSDDVLAAADKAPPRPRIDAIYNQEHQAWQLPGDGNRFLTPPKPKAADEGFNLERQSDADAIATEAEKKRKAAEALEQERLAKEALEAEDKKKQLSLLDEVDEVDEVLNYQQAQERRREELLSGPRTEWLNPDRYFDDMSKAERAVRAARTDPTRGHRALTGTRTLRGPFWEELRQSALVAAKPDLGRAGSVDAVIKQLKTLGVDTLEEMGLPLFKLGREVDEAKVIAQFLQDPTRKADFLAAIGRKSELFQAAGTDVPSLQAAAVRILETSNPLERTAAQKAVRTLLQREGDTAAGQTRKELWEMWERGGLSQDVLVSMEILVKRMETVQEYLKMAFKGEKRGGTVFRSQVGDPTGGTKGLTEAAGREFVQELGGLHGPRPRRGVEGVDERLRNKMYQGLFNNPKGGAETIKELGNLWMSLTTMLALMTFGGMGSMPGQGGGLNAATRAS